MKIFLAAALLLASSPGATASDLERILDLNDKAHGGDALDQVQTVRVQLQITEPTFEVSGNYIASRDGLMRIDIYAGGGRVFAEGLTRECAWEWNPAQPAENSGTCVGEAESAALRHGIEMPGHFYTLKDVRDRGATIDLIGKVETDSESEWQLRVTLADGFSRDYFLSQETHRITRARDFRAFHPGIDPTGVRIETRYGSPALVGGALRFKHQVNVNLDTGEVLGTTTVLDYELNPGVTAEMFEAGWVPSSALAH